MNEPSRRKRKPRTTTSGVGDLGFPDLDGCTRNSVGKVDGKLHDNVSFGVDESEDTLSDTAPEVPVSVVDLSTLTFDDEDEVVYIGTKDASIDNNQINSTMFSSSLISDNHTDLDSSHSSFRITNSSNTNIYIKQEPISDESDVDEKDVFSEHHEDELSCSSGFVEKLWEQCSIAPSEKHSSAVLTDKKSCTVQGVQSEDLRLIKPCFVKCEKLDINKLNLKNKKSSGSVKLSPRVGVKPSKRNNVCSGVKKNHKNVQVSKGMSSPSNSLPKVVFQTPQRTNTIPTLESSPKMSFVKILPSRQTHSQLQNEKPLLPSASVQRPAYVIRSLPDLKLSLLVPVQQCVGNAGVQPASEKPIFLSSNLGQTNMTNCAMIVNRSTQINENSTKKAPSKNPVSIDHDLLSVKEIQKYTGLPAPSDTLQGHHRKNSTEASFYGEEEFRNDIKQTTMSQCNSSATIVAPKDLRSCNVKLIKIDKSACEEQKLLNKDTTAKQPLHNVAAHQNLPDFNVSSEETVSDNSYDSRDFMINKTASEETDVPESSPVMVKKVELRKDLISKRLTVDLRTDQSVDVLCKDDKTPVNDTSCKFVESVNESDVSLCGTHDNPEIDTTNGDANHVENCTKKEINTLEDCASEKEAIDFLSNLSPSEFLKVCSAVMNHSAENNLPNPDSTEHLEKKDIINLAECTSEKDAIDCLSKLSTEEFLRICSGAADGVGDAVECEERLVNSKQLGSCEEPEDTTNISKSEDKSDETDQLQTDSVVVEGGSDTLSAHSENSVCESSEEDGLNIEEEMPSPLPPDQETLDHAFRTGEFDSKQKSDVQIKSVFEKEMWDVLFNSADTSYESDEVDVCSFSAVDGDSSGKAGGGDLQLRTHEHTKKTNLKTQPSDKKESITTRSKGRRANQNCILSKMGSEQEHKGPKNSTKAENESTACSSVPKKNVSESLCQSSVTAEGRMENKSDVSLSSSPKSSQHSRWTRRSRRKEKELSVPPNEEATEKNVKDKVLNISGNPAEFNKTSAASSESNVVSGNKNSVENQEQHSQNKKLEDSIMTKSGNENSVFLSHDETIVESKRADESSPISSSSVAENVTANKLIQSDDDTNSTENVVELCQKNLLLNDIPISKSENEERETNLPSQHGEGKENVSFDGDKDVRETVIAKTGTDVGQEFHVGEICNWPDASVKTKSESKIQIGDSVRKSHVPMHCTQKEISENNNLETEDFSSSSSNNSGVDLRPSNQNNAVLSPACDKKGEIKTSLASESNESAEESIQKDLTKNDLTGGKSGIYVGDKTTDYSDVKSGANNENLCTSIDHTKMQDSLVADDVPANKEDIAVGGTEGVHDSFGEEQESASSKFARISQVKEPVLSPPCKTSRRRKSLRSGYRKRKRRKSGDKEQGGDAETSAVGNSTINSKEESTTKANLMSDHEIGSPKNDAISVQTSDQSQSDEETVCPCTTHENKAAEQKITGGDVTVNSILTVDKTSFGSSKSEERIIESTVLLGNTTGFEESISGRGPFDGSLCSSLLGSNDDVDSKAVSSDHRMDMVETCETNVQKDKTTEDSPVRSSKTENRGIRHHRNSRTAHRRRRKCKSVVAETDELTSVAPEKEGSESEICLNSGTIVGNHERTKEEPASEYGSLEDSDSVNDRIINKEQAECASSPSHSDEKESETLSTCPSVAKNPVKGMTNSPDKCISSNEIGNSMESPEGQKNVNINEKDSIVSNSETDEQNLSVVAPDSQNGSPQEQRKEETHDAFEESSNSSKGVCNDDMKLTVQDLDVAKQRRGRGRPRKVLKILQEEGRERPQNLEVLKKMRGNHPEDAKRLQKNSGKEEPLKIFRKLLRKNIAGKNMAISGAVVMSTRWALRNRNKSFGVSERCLRSQKMYNISVEDAEGKANEAEETKLTKKQSVKNNESCNVQKSNDSNEQQLEETPCKTITGTELCGEPNCGIEDEQETVKSVQNDQLKAKSSTPSVIHQKAAVKDSEGQEIVVDDENEFSSTKHQEINYEGGSRNDLTDNNRESSEHRNSDSCKPTNVCQMSGEKTVSPLKLIKEKVEGLKSGAGPAYRVELSPEEASENCGDTKSFNFRTRKQCKSRNRRKQLIMELTSVSEKPSLCLSSEMEKHVEADVSLPSEIDQESSKPVREHAVNSPASERRQSICEEGSEADKSLEIMKDNAVITNSDIEKTIKTENISEESEDSSEVPMEISSSSIKIESEENISEDNLPEGQKASDETIPSTSATRKKRKLSVAHDKVPNTDNETSEEVPDAPSDSSESKRKKSTCEDKVPTKEVSSESTLPNPSPAATPKMDGQPVSDLSSKDLGITIKSEPLEPVRYSFSGRKICRKSFSDELYVTPDLGKSSASKDEKKPPQISSSGRKISKKSFGDDVHTPSTAGISPATPKSTKSEKKRPGGDFVKPFTMGWMREVVYRATNDSPQVGKRKADIYYFSPEGTKLRSMPEIGAYLNKHKVVSLDLTNFTFVKETIYREPFEKERSAKIKLAPAATNSSATKQPPKKEVTSDTKPASVTVEKRVPKIKLPFTFPSSVKNSNKTANAPAKEEKPKKLKKNANNQTVSNQNITPKRKKIELAGEKRKLDLNPLLVSTKKLLQPQNWETDTVRRCSKQCPDSNSEDPSLQCKKCLCLFHPRCVSIKLKKNHKYDFVCKLCSTGIEGSTQSNRQEMNDSNHVTEKTTNSSSCEEVSEINLVPEVVLEQNPHDPPIKQLEWRNKNQPDMAALTRPYCGPPPLKRAPENKDRKNKVENSNNALQGTPGHETSNGVSVGNSAICSALGPGTKLPPLLPGTFILRNRLTQNKRPSPPMAHSVNVAADKSPANPQSGVSYHHFTGSSQAAGSTMSSPAVSLSTTTTSQSSKSVKSARFILPAPSINTPTSSLLLQGQNPSSSVQQMKVTPYSSTIVVAQSSSYHVNKNNTVVTYTKVDSVSPGSNAADKTNRQPLKMCDFNIVPANGSNQVSPPGVVNNSTLNDVTAQSGEGVNDVNSQILKPNQPKGEKHRNSLPASSQKVMADVCTPTKDVKCQQPPSKVSGTSLHSEQYSSSEEYSPVKNSVENKKASDGNQKMWTDRADPMDGEHGISFTSPVCGINKLMWGFDALNLIFEKLPVNDLLRASQVCRSWRNLASQHFLWRNISLRDLKIRNWKRCANALRRYRTSSLDLRGLQHISDSDNTWNEFIGIIKFLKHLEKIVFGQVPPSVITSLSEFLTQLRSLECYCLTDICEEPDLWNSSCTFDFSCIKNLRQLERLRIRSANELKVSSEVLASALCDLPALQHLSLTSFANLHGSDFGFLKNLKNLLSLELGDTKNWECENFVVLAELPNLQALRLDNGGSVSDTGLAEAIMKMKDLQELRLINYKIPSNLGSALKKARSLRRLSIWPDNSSEAALVNYNALEAVSKVKKLTYFCWGILIADGNQDLTDGCRPLVDVLKHGSSDSKVAEDVLHLSSVDLLERLYYLLPNVEVQVECIHRSKFNKYWTVHK